MTQLIMWAAMLFGDADGAATASYRSGSHSASGMLPGVVVAQEPSGFGKEALLSSPVEEELPPDTFVIIDGHDTAHPVPYLPEGYQKPRPLTWLKGFLDPEPIQLYPNLHWFNHGHQITPALTVYGAYSVFGAGNEDNNQTRAGIGHQLLIDVDLSFGATERLHAQWRPVGEKNSGGSFLQLNNDVRYIDNATPLPQTIWFEGSVSEIFSGYIPDTVVADWALTAGLYPYQLHNQLLINDDIVGVMLSKDTFIFEPFSNILVQSFFAFDEIDAFSNEDDVRMAGAHVTADWQQRFIELTYIHLWDVTASDRNQEYLAASVTQLMGPLNIAGRFLANIGDEGRDGGGQLYVLEGNWTRLLDGCRLFESVVVYSTAFWATEGWNPASGGSFDRLRSNFAVNPLVRLSVDNQGIETRGIATGAEFFGTHEDWAVIPEFAAEFPQDDEVFSFGCRLRRQIGKRSQVELRGLTSITDRDRLRRHGVFLEWITFF